MKPPDKKGKGTNQKIALTSLHEAIAKFGEMQTINGMRNKCIKIEQWRVEFKARLGSDVHPETLKKAWQRVKLDLVEMQKVVIYDDMCWAVFEENEDAKQSNSVVSLVKK